jgi:lipoate-protein ligase B
VTSPPVPLSPRERGDDFPLPFREGGQGVRSVSLLRLGRVEYGDAWALQQRLAEARRAGQIEDTLILLEHPHVYTLGRRADEAHVLADPARLAAIGATLFRIDRGGDVTYHGPGQIVGYPILDLKQRGADVHQYVRDVEETIIRTLADYGIESGRSEVNAGVWVGDEKIAAIGVKVAHWVTSHGFALNVDPDLAYFREIVPCGLHEKGVTSMSRLLGRRVDPDEVATRLARRFAEVFGYALS